MESRIVFLRGAERVRKRPAVIFGDDGMEGVQHAFESVLNTLAKEGINGFSNQLIITQYWDGSISMEDNGRGIFLGFPDSSDDSVWKALFCELYAGSAYSGIQNMRSIFEPPCTDNSEILDNFELCAAQYASEYLDVCVHRDGIEYSLRFEKGEHVGGLNKVPCEHTSGTYIRFKPDLTVFSDIVLSEEWLSEKVNALALQIPGMKVILRAETKDGCRETTFWYPLGISDYLHMQNTANSASGIFCSELEAEGQERYNKPRYPAKVKIGMCFAKEAGFSRYYHNQRNLTYGGTHVDALLSEISKLLAWTLEHKIRKEDLLTHLQLVVVTEAKITNWQNGTRRSIENTLIRDMAQDTLGERFRVFLKQNQEFLNDLFGCKVK